MLLLIAWDECCFVDFRHKASRLGIAFYFVFGRLMLLLVGVLEFWLVF